MSNTSNSNLNPNATARLKASTYVVKDETTRMAISKKDGSFTIFKPSGKHRKEKAYNIAPNFIPQDISDICSEFIYNYCKANGQMKWLKEQKESCVSESGKPLNIKLRGEFVDMFFKSLRNRTTNGAATMFDFIDDEED